METIITIFAAIGMIITGVVVGSFLISVIDELWKSKWERVDE